MWSFNDLVFINPAETSIFIETVSRMAACHIYTRSGYTALWVHKTETLTKHHTGIIQLTTPPATTCTRENSRCLNSPVEQLSSKFSNTRSTWWSWSVPSVGKARNSSIYQNKRNWRPHHILNKNMYYLTKIRHGSIYLSLRFILVILWNTPDSWLLIPSLVKCYHFKQQCFPRHSCSSLQ